MALGGDCTIVQCIPINVQCSLMKKAARPVSPIDYSLYAGRWIAMVRDRVAGVGRTADEARQRAKAAWPKDEPQIVFVPKNYRKGDQLTKR